MPTRSPGDAGDEPFDVRAVDIDFRQPHDHIDSRIGGPWTGFTAFFKNPAYMLEKGRYDFGPPLSASPEPSGQHFPRLRSLPGRILRHRCWPIFLFADGVRRACG